ncbi:MAG: RHS repeat-associated core domain-containing protein [Clostridia bacterium]|nr:RHS repeat-associated core domain-containing protein [Clostridia bacterium]
MDGVEHTYYYDGGQLIAETWGNSYLRFTYDENGTLLRLYYHNGTTTTMYYYVLNLQGDVLEIRDTANNVVCKYSYDTWGKILSIKDGSGNAITSAGHIGNINPMRYRGYYYDTETGLYYVSSRYYDPEIGRWISPEPNVDYGDFDEGAGLLGYNVYAYCANNPVMFKDETGESITLACVLIGAGIGLLAGGGFGVYRASKKGYSPSDGWKYWKYVVGYGVAGGAVGALVGWGAGALIAKYGVATAATSITKGGGARFSTFKALKNSLGSAGKGRQWHHIVEQCQIKTSRAGFSKYWVHNSNNVINITDDVHQLISNFYSSIPNKQVVNTGGKVFRDWLIDMSFEQQYKWGIWVLRYFGVKV